MQRIILMLMLVCRAWSHMFVAKPKNVGGCYHGEEGTFFWTVKGDELILEITAHPVLTTEWIGIGFSDDAKMGRDDVVAVVGREGTFQALALYNSHGQTATIHNPANTSLLSSKLTYNDGELEARVVKSISKSHPLDLTKPCYLFFARGPINSVNPMTPVHRHIKTPAISRTTVDINLFMPDCVSVRTNIFIKLHGTIMVAVWLNLTILTMFIARYAKHYFKQQSMWYTLHRNSGIAAGVLVVVSVMLAAAGVSHFEPHRHQLVGISVAILLVLHVLLAVCKPSKEQQYRTMWEYLHKATAVSLHGLSFFNILSGLQMLKVHYMCFVLITVQVVYFCLLFIVMENPHQLRTCTNFLNKHFGTAAYFKLDTDARFSGNILAEEEQDSEFDDITMVTMNLEQPTTRLDYTHWGMFSLLGLNTLSVLVITCSLIMT